MSVYKVGICGHYGGEKVFLDGQTVKTKNVTAELIKKYGEQRVITADTYGGIKSLFNCLKKLHFMLKNCENIVILPAHNSIKIFPAFLVGLNRFYHRKLHYIVIGGWLPEFIQDKKSLQKKLIKFDAIYVETNIMKESLKKQGFENVFVMNNFKQLEILKEEELVYSDSMPSKLCTFSRVLKEKGIEDAIEAVQYINKKYKKEVFTLDIYGQIDEGYVESFKQIQKDLPDYIKYKGLVPYDESVNTLKEYYALLFPTYYAGEGFAGTLIDALAAGLPVIASDWRYNSEIVKENKTGLLFQAMNVKALIDRLEQIYINPNICNNMRLTCLREAYKYLPSNAIKIFLENME